MQHGKAQIPELNDNILCVSEINSVLEINYEIGYNQRMK
jgi:hypothetical protein